MQVDVAIIGGGPAACATALTLRSLGLSVCVISAKGRKERPTETAVPVLPDLLGSLGAPEAITACEPCFGIVSAWGATEPAFRPGITSAYGHPWFIHRERFDTCLKKAVCDGGAEWHEREALGLSYHQNGVTISTDHQSLRAHWAVVATGSPASAAYLTSQKVTQMDSMFTFWARLSVGYGERLLRVEPTDLGWWYICPADGAGAFACFVTDLATARNFHPNEVQNWNTLFRNTEIFRALPSGAEANMVHVALTGIATLPQTCGTHWIAVGDAAAKLDPLGSSGLATALYSGRRAANAVADVLQGKNAALESHCSWTAAMVREFLYQRCQLYANETVKRGSGFWRRRFAPPFNFPVPESIPLSDRKVYRTRQNFLPKEQTGKQSPALQCRALRGTISH